LFGGTSEQALPGGGAEAGQAVNTVVFEPLEVLELLGLLGPGSGEGVPEGSGALAPASESLAILPPHAARSTRPTANVAAAAVVVTPHSRFTLPVWPAPRRSVS
jgi:hypothetical protein